MESTCIIILAASLLTVLYFFFIKNKKEATDYASTDIYFGKTYFDICRQIGNPILSERQLYGLTSTWLIDDQRITLTFDEDLLFCTISSFSKLPKAVKYLKMKKTRVPDKNIRIDAV